MYRKTCNQLQDPCIYVCISTILYSRNVWRIWRIVHDSSPTLKPSKSVLTINNLLADLVIRQTFFCQMFEKSQFAKLSRLLYGSYLAVLSNSNVCMCTCVCYSMYMYVSDAIAITYTTV